jgi:hypothetical protein
MADEPGIRIRNDVVFAGENSLLMLYRPGTRTPVAVASYWRCSYSATGAGEALVIWVDPEASGLGDRAPVGIYADNAVMASLVWDLFNSHFEPLQGHGIEEMTPEPARFSVYSDDMRLYRATCVAGKTAIELEWRDATEALHTVTTPEVGGIQWEVTNVICPCTDAGVRVNGRVVTGEVGYPEGWFRSSAFLAFAESWVRIG